MPTRDNAIVVCTCGWKTGTVLERLGGDPEIEETLLRAQVPRMVRHWQLGHRLTGRREYAMVIASEAMKIRDRMTAGADARADRRDI